MRLNCALVFSCLFVSAVLADFHREQQQPPFIEKSIDPTTILLPINPQSAGMVWAPSQNQKGVDTAIGGFTVPKPHGDFDSGFKITVGISGWCSTITLAVGIAVKVIGANVVSYQAWGGWLPEVPVLAPDWFKISAGDGTFTLINRKTGRNWSSEVHGHRIDCEPDAQWLVATFPTDSYIPNFVDVTFMDILYRISGDKKSKLPSPFEVELYNIVENRQNRTTIIYYPFLVIIYNSELV